MINIAPVSEHRMIFDEAWLYCMCLYHNGYSDWQLPNWYQYLKHDEINGWTIDDYDPDNFTRKNKVTPVRYT